MKKNNIIIDIMLIIYSLIATAGIFLYVNLNSKMYNSILWLILFATNWYMIKTLKKTGIKKIIYTSILSCIYSALLVLGTSLEVYSDINWNLYTIGTIFLLSLYIEILILYICEKLKRELIADIKNENNKKNKIIIFLVIFAVWFIVYLALYPGVYGYDAGFQILQFQDSETSITTHFSVLYSFILYSFIWIGKTIFNSNVVGFGIYTFFQMLLNVFVVYKICLYVLKKFSNIKILICTIAFYIFNPFIIILSISSCQDAIFGAIFALLVLFFMNIIENEEYFKPLKNKLLYAILVFALCAIRNNGLYALIFVIPFMFICLKKYRIKLVAITLLTITILQAYQNIIKNIEGIQSGDSLKEMISVPMQQLGRVYNYNIESLSSEELKYVTDLVPEDKLKLYEMRPSISDSLKGYTDTQMIKENMGEFIGNYLKIFWKNKDEYVEAFLLNTIGFWYPDKVYPDERMYHPYMEYEMLDAKQWNEKYIEIERTSLIKPLENIFNNFIGNNIWNKVPILSNIYNMGTYFFVFIAVIVYLIYKKSYKYFLPMSLIMGLYITLFLSPVALFRYTFPIILIVPLIISIFFNREEEKNNG